MATEGGNGGNNGEGAGLLATALGSQNPIFNIPNFSRLPFFGYANLSDQIQDAMGLYKQGAGAWSGNALPKYAHQAGGEGVPSTFKGGFANMAPTVGGNVLGASAYQGGPNPFLNGFNPFAGRGIWNGGPPGTTPPGPPGGGGGSPPGGTTPGPTNPGNGVWPTRPNVPNQPPNAGGITNPILNNGSTPNSTTTTKYGMGGLLAPGGAPSGNNGGPMSKTTVNYPTAAKPAYPNTFEVPQNNQTIKTASGKEVPNPFGLTSEQIYFALSGHPDAIRRLSESLGATGGQTMQNGQLVMTPQNQLFHQIVNYYASGGGAFNTGYTPEDAFNAQKSYSQGLGEKTFETQTWPKGMEIRDSSGKVIGYATGQGTNYTPV